MRDGDWNTADRLQLMQRLREVATSGPFTPEGNSLGRYRVPDWYQDAKFGIFIHWGVYSVPAFGNEWYPRNMYAHGSDAYRHHVATYGSPGVFGYKDFIPMFKAERFDPDAWANLFRLAGAKFVVPVAEHHDGFALYDCPFTKWNAAQMGPGRDVIGELAAAVRRQWLVFGLSSHRAEHWWFFNRGLEIESDIRDARHMDLYGPAQPEGASPNEQFLEDWLARCCHLVDRYQPQIFWFDWWIEQPAFEPYLRQFASYYYNRAHEWQRGAAINYKNQAFPEGIAVLDIERGQLAHMSPRFWQTDTSVCKNSWGYVEERDYRSAGSLIGDLVDIVSKNGALLLNVGPRPDGTIPEPEQELLLTIGRWLSVNGEAVFGTRPWRIFGEGPTQVMEGSFTDARRERFTSRDVRFTTRATTLYAIVLSWPEDGKVTITSLGEGLRLLQQRIEKVELVGSRAPVTWGSDAEGLHVELPQERPSEHALVLRITPESRQQKAPA